MMKNIKRSVHQQWQEHRNVYRNSANTLTLRKKKQKHQKSYKLCTIHIRTERKAKKNWRKKASNFFSHDITYSKHLTKAAGMTWRETKRKIPQCKRKKFTKKKHQHTHIHAHEALLCYVVYKMSKKRSVGWKWVSVFVYVQTESWAREKHIAERKKWNI